MHSIFAKAVAFDEALTSDFVEYQKQVILNAQIMANKLLKHGINLVSKDIKNHMFLMNFLDQDFSGKQVESWLDDINITTNKNTVPFDIRSPFQTSGIRIGTPAITTRGMKANEMEIIADIIAKKINNPSDVVLNNELEHKVLALCAKFPIMN